MLVALVPRPAARRAVRPNPLLPAFALGAAAVITLASASALVSLVPSNAISRQSSQVFGPAVRLAAVQVVASK
jgi:hypothetical protein